MDNSVISVIKNSVVLPIESLQYVEAPFSFVISGSGKKNLDGSEIREFPVENGDRVVYFQRKRMKISKGKVVANFIYRICIGRICPDGTNDCHWISPEGNYLEPNTELIKKI